MIPVKRSVNSGTVLFLKQWVSCVAYFEFSGTVAKQVDFGWVMKS